MSQTAKCALASNRRLALAIRNGKAAPARDGAQISSCSLHGVHHGVADSAEVLEVSARADVHVQADEVEPVAVDARQRFAQVFVPDAVFARLATGVDLVAVPVAEARVDAQPNGVTAAALAELRQHVF